jgi:hypothetical protein
VVPFIELRASHSQALPLDHTKAFTFLFNRARDT